MIGCLALFLGLALWAFTDGASEQKPANTFTEEWFEYIDGDPYDPDSYIMVGSQPSCNGNTQLCAVRATKQNDADLPTSESLITRGSQSQGFTVVVQNAVLRKP